MDNRDLQAIRQLMQEELKPVHDRLDGIDQRLDGIDKRLDGVDNRLDGVDRRQDEMEKRLDIMQADIRQIKRDTAITRVAVNSLIEWVDSAQDAVGVRYPTK